MSRDPQERVLVLAPVGRDAALTCELLAAAAIHAESCVDGDDLCDRLARGGATVIVAEEALPSTAARLHAALAAAPAWSDLPLILMTTRAGGWEGAVARLGTRANITLLERPVRAATLVRAVQAGLTARRRQYEVRDLVARLEGAVAERDRFLAMLGHELRNPLAAVVNAVELLDADGHENGNHAEYRDVIARQSRQLARLVDDLLDVSRVSAGKIALQSRIVDLVRVVGQCYDLILCHGRSGHRCTFEAPDAPVLVHGDPARLEQIASNLLTNALKYTPIDGRIRVEVRAEKPWAVLRVSDTGIGISPEDLPHVFDLFVQADKSLDRSQGGLGLGLTLVKSLVGLHDGEVQADSPGPGRGSTFTVRLPLQDVAAVAAPSPPAPADPSCCRVLVVEDNPDNRRILQRLLRVWGYHADAAQDGPEGIALALSTRPDVALIDIGLPGLDGYQVAREIRHHLGDAIHLIALTGYGQPEDRRRTAEAGFDEHLVKPIEPDRLRQLLSHLPTA